MTGLYISLDAILAFLVIGAGFTVGFLGALSLYEVLSKREYAALLPAAAFGIPGTLLLLAGWRILVLS